MRLEKPWHVGQPVCCLYVATTSALRQGLRGFLDPDELYFQPPWQAADRGGRRGASRSKRGFEDTDFVNISHAHLPLYPSSFLSMELKFQSRA